MVHHGALHGPFTTKCVISKCLAKYLYIITMLGFLEGYMFVKYDTGMNKLWDYTLYIHIFSFTIYAICNGRTYKNTFHHKTWIIWGVTISIPSETWIFGLQQSLLLTYNKVHTFHVRMTFIQCKTSSGMISPS